MSASAGKSLSYFVRKSEPLTSRLKLPEKLKGGRIERYVNYWKGVATDYREAVKDLGQSCKDKPIKAVLVGSASMAIWYANRHNPDEKSFHQMLTRINNDLTLVPESHRNKTSSQHQFTLVRANNAGVLRHWNLGIFSIMWKDNYNADFGHYKSKCKYLTVGYGDILYKEPERIIDIGFLDCWWLTKKAMEDYDIDSDEWDEEGRPTNTKGQLREMW